MPPINARKRALQELMVSPVGPPPALASKPVDLAAIAPPSPEEEYAGYSAGGPLPIDELTRLQQRAAVGNLVADLGQITAQGIENLTGAKYAPEIYSGMRARASEPLKDYMRLQEQKQKALTPTALKPVKSTDPNSPESMRWRAVFKQMFPSEDDSNITEANAETAIKYLTVQRGQDTSVGNATAAITMRQKELEQSAQQFAAREGREWATLSQQERLKYLDLAEKEKDRTERGLKTTRELNERNVGGYEFDPMDPPSADAAKKMADMSIQAKVFTQGLDSLEKLYRSHGTELIGDKAGVMGPEWKNLTDILRNMSNMGVPNGKDYEMLALQLENPTERQSLLTSKARGLAQMKTTREQVNRLLKATAEAYKYRPVAAPNTPTSKAQPKRVTPQQAMPTDAAGTLTLDTPSTARKPVSETLSKDRKHKKITYSDGSVEVVNAGP